LTKLVFEEESKMFGWWPWKKGRLWQREPPRSDRGLADWSEARLFYLALRLYEDARRKAEAERKRGDTDSVWHEIARERREDVLRSLRAAWRISHGRGAVVPVEDFQELASAWERAGNVRWDGH
jgi:hypothetical protein